MVIDTAKLRISTKALAAAFFSFGALMQVGPVSQFVTRATLNHPHIAALLASLVSISILLHNPEVGQILGIQTTVQVTETKATTLSTTN